MNNSDTKKFCIIRRHLFRKFSINWLYFCAIVWFLYPNVCATNNTVDKEKKQNQQQSVIIGSESYVLEWIDPGGLPHEDTVVFSKPKCLNEDGHIVTRIRTSKGWLQEESECKYIELSKKCPPRFQDNDDYCVTFTEPQTIDGSCPYPGATYIDDFKYDDFLWLPLKRSDKYSPYRVTMLGSKYMKKYKVKCSSKCCSQSENFSHNCLIANSSCIQDVLCNKRYPHLCAYRYDHFLYNCPRGCMAAGLGKNYCYCVAKTEMLNKTRDSFCQTLAEPFSSVEVDKMQDLADSDVCWIYLETTEIAEDNETKYPAITEDKIGMYTDGSLSCAICKTSPINFSNPEIMLTFDQSSRKLYARVFHPMSLFESNDDEVLYCFLNKTMDLSEKVDVNEIWDSEDDEDDEFSRPFRIYEVSLELDTQTFYWCEAFKLPQLDRITSNVVKSYKKVKGCRFASRIIIQKYCSYLDTCKNIQRSDIDDLLKELFKKIRSPWYRILTIEVNNVDEDNEVMDLLIHFIFKSCYNLIGLRNFLEFEIMTSLYSSVSVKFLRSVDYCFPESTLTGTKELSWALTASGSTVLAKNVCVQNNFLPVTRTCKEDFYHGAHWLPVEGSCSGRSLSDASLRLLNISQSTINNTTIVLKNISKIIQTLQETNVLDTYSVSSILYEASSVSQFISMEDFEETLDIVDSLYDFDDDLLKESQELLNSTDTILDATERFLDAINVSSLEKNLVMIKRKNILTLVTNPFVNNISGLVVHAEEFDSFLDVDVDYLYVNTTVDYLQGFEDLEVASFISNATLSHLLTKNNISTTDFKIAIMIYYSESFFQSRVSKVGSRVISVSMPGFNCLLPFSVPVFFKSEKNNSNCGFWNFGNAVENNKGHWSTVGSEKSGRLFKSVDSCVFSHLTHFALLVSNFELHSDQGDPYYIDIQSNISLLELITLLGCLLSVCGILGIYTTAIIFPSWRNKAGNKILLQLSHTILFIIIGLYLLDTLTLDNTVWCITLGVALHYAILAKFSWVLVSAILQFYRFVIVIGPMPSHIILKSMIIGWGLPTIPVIIVVATNFDAYGKEMCYPKHYSLYLGVLLPIFIILSINIYVFVKVMHSVCKSNSRSPHPSKNIVRRELCLAVLLLFLLGLPWLFGLMVELAAFNNFLRNTFAYLFCILASIEGFVLFIFYVFLDNGTRRMWSRFFLEVFGKVPDGKQKSPLNSVHNTKDSKVVIISDN